jgi:hypothetical protein
LKNSRGVLFQVGFDVLVRCLVVIVKDLLLLLNNNGDLLLIFLCNSFMVI